MSAVGSSGRRSPWPDLPAELLGLVLLRLASHADRVRLPAVCRAWRSAARLQQPLPPLLPWLVLPDGTFLSLPDGAVHRVPVPDDVSYGLSTGSAQFLVHADGKFSLTSPSTAATVTLRKPPFWYLATDEIRKVVVSDHLVAVLRDSTIAVYTRGGGGVAELPLPAWASRSTACLQWAPPVHDFIADIAIFQGKLYVLTEREALHVLDAGDRQITDVCCIPNTTPSHDDFFDVDHLQWSDLIGADTDVYNDYLVVSGDQLLRVKRTIHIPAPTPPWMVDKGTSQLDVFEASGLSSGGRGWWRDVTTSLMGRSLFVSQACSLSVPAAAAGDQCGGHAGVRPDCIYFLAKDDTTSSSLFSLPPSRRIRENPFLGSCVYNMRDRTLAPLPLETSTLAEHHGMWPPAWFFPEA